MDNANLRVPKAICGRTCKGRYDGGFDDVSGTDILHTNVRALIQMILKFCCSPLICKFAACIKTEMFPLWLMSFKMIMYMQQIDLQLGTKLL